jgi:two-component system, chemotaxis family, sensor kinase Cph1
MNKPKATPTRGDIQPENTQVSPGTSEDLRRRAEEALQGKPEETEELIGEAVQRLIQELQIHQIELEMQNEALRQTQVELEAARDRYFDIFELAPVGYLMLSKKGIILEANIAAANLLGIERARLKQTPLTDYIAREDQDIFYLGAQQARQENRSQEFELRMLTNAGRPIDVSLQCTGVEEQGQMRLTLSDITHRKQQSAELRAYAQRLESLNLDLERFADVVSHDLKEPLRKIKGFGNLLFKENAAQLDEQGRYYVERMQQAAVRMEKLIEALLSLSRLSTQKPCFQVVDLNKVVQAVLTDLEMRLRETGGQIETSPLPCLTAEPTQMQQLFMNIIGNALKFHQPETPPLVQIHSSLTAAGEVEIQVTDNGIGFEPEAAAKLFKPFARLHGMSKYEGTGIGLAICRKIVENHGGTITACSRQWGKGRPLSSPCPFIRPAWGWLR